MVKIILVSAYDKFEYAKRAIRLGAYDYIEKPLDYMYLTEKIQNAFLQLDKIRKNQELLRASRPLMTDKFFDDLLHYPGEDPDIRLGSFLEYLDLKTDYDYFIVLVLEAEYTGDAGSHPDFAQFQMELLNILDLLKEKFHGFSYFHYLTDADEITCILGGNCHSHRKFLQSVHNTVEDVILTGNFFSLCITQ